MCSDGDLLPFIVFCENTLKRVTNVIRTRGEVEAAAYTER